MKSPSKMATPVLASYLLAAIALLLVLKAGFLVALFSGLLVYSLVHLMVPTIQKKYTNKQARLIAVVFLSTIVIASISFGIWGVVVFFRSDAGSLSMLLQKLANIIEASHSQIPDWARVYFPEDVDALGKILTNGLLDHAVEAKTLSQQAGHLIVHLLLGMIIGSMLAMQDAASHQQYRPFSAALYQRISNMAQMFHKVVFAQVTISFINTVFTGIYLVAVLPMLGVHLPLTTSLIAITFFAGLIPVLGNILSNTAIVIVSLSHSPHIAALSLTYMVVIHKLEYFLNARIIGSQVNAKSWELLTAILVMETLFGLPGVVAAPVFYAYIKKELSDQGMV
jgi:predicted PurR-regulated permease PerM